MILLAIGLLLVVGSVVVATWLLEPEHPTTALVIGGTLGLVQLNVAVLIAGALLDSLQPTTLLGATAACAVLTIALATAYGGIDQLRDLGDRLGEGGRRDAPTGTRALEAESPADADADAEVDADADLPVAGDGSPTRGGGRAIDVEVLDLGAAGGLARLRQTVLAAAFDHPFHLVGVVAVVALYAWQVTLAIALPIVDYDGLALHATAVAHWVTSGGFEPSGLSVTVDSAPLGPAAISAWAATFTGSLRAMFVTQLAFAVLGAAAVADLARRFGARTADAVLAAALFAAVPVVALQATSAYADLGASSSLLAAWTFALAAHRRAAEAVEIADWRRRQLHRERWRDLVLAGTALGLAVGARPANLAAVALTAVVVVAGCVVVARRDREGRPVAHLGRSAAALAVLLVPVLLVGGYWYGRNWVEHGNPVHPFTVGPFEGQGTVEELILAPNRPEALDEVGGRFAQVAASWAADLSPGTYAIDQRLGGLGPAFLLAMVPGLVLFASRARWSAGVAVVAGAVAVVAVLPAPWWSRATLFLPGVAAAALAAVLPAERGAARHGVLAGVVGLALWGVWSTAATSTYTDAGTHQRLRLGEAFALVREDDRVHQVLPYDGYEVLDGYPDGTVVGVIDGQIPAQRAPLYGRDLQRQLVVLPAVSDADELAQAMAAAEVDVAVVAISAGALVEEIRQTDAPLQIVAERGSSPARTVLVTAR